MLSQCQRLHILSTPCNCSILLDLFLVLLCCSGSSLFRNMVPTCSGFRFWCIGCSFVSLFASVVEGRRWGFWCHQTFPLFSLYHCTVVIEDKNRLWIDTLLVPLCHLLSFLRDPRSSFSSELGDVVNLFWLVWCTSILGHLLYADLVDLLILPQLFYVWWLGNLLCMHNLGYWPLSRDPLPMRYLLDLHKRHCLQLHGSYVDVLRQHLLGHLSIRGVHLVPVCVPM